MTLIGFQSFSAFAGMSDLATSSQALDEQVVGTSTATSQGAHLSRSQKFLTLSFMAMFTSPGFNNMDGHMNPQPAQNSGTTKSPSGRTGRKKGRGAVVAPADATTPGTTTATVPAASTPATAPGASMRYVIAASARLSSNMVLGPSVDFSQKFYGSEPKKLKLGDPQLKLAISDVIRTNIGPHNFKSSLWFSASAPTSDQSRNNHALTSVGASFIPRLAFAHSDFSLSGMGSIRSTLVHKDIGDGILTPLRFFLGIQANYKMSRPLSTFLMVYSSATTGPEIPMGDADLASDNSGSNGTGGRKLGIMPGGLIRATDFISISPRMNWTVGKPMNTTTVGLNANIQMI
ncbi:MAG: hypothetical protein HY074_13655 [Deltaproteobacteria bacterium]|nr:hypothetical protein [Deltaproteobacteria bacterium]